jgi:hypothetical protein
MNYFEAITHRCSELDTLGANYLNSFEFLPNDEVCQQIFKIAKSIFTKAGEDWEAVPEWVASTMDGWMPYASVPQNGSLYFSLGFSCVSQDAHLRNLLERAKGTETKELDFEVVADKKIVAKYCGMNEDEPTRLLHKLPKPRASSRNSLRGNTKGSK